jgi:hypothetical protein
VVAVCAVVLAGTTAEQADAQFSDPCEFGCAIVLAGASYAFAMGTVSAVGRLTGGFSTSRQGIATWTLGFAVAAGAGMALASDGGRQQRAVYGAGIGAVAGGLAGLAVESLGESSKATRLAASLIGSAVGVLAGGVIGATTYDPDPGNGAAQPAMVAPGLSFAIRF